MEKFLIVCKSITHAQKICNILKKNCIWYCLTRAPVELNLKKCSYVVTINKQDFEKFSELAKSYKITPVPYFSLKNKVYTKIGELA